MVPMTSRTTFGRSPNSFIPAPYPVFAGVKGGGTPNFSSATSPRSRHAPVGVMSSPRIDGQGKVGTPHMSSRVAGAGTGIRPCWQRTKPEV